MKTVSLYIPCFNAAKTICFCLDAVFKQTCPLEEVLVIDDGSIDETVELANQYPVRVIKQNKNFGLAAARNTAIRNARAEFIASLDADCVPEPDWLKHLMERFDSPKIAGIGGKLLESDSSSVFDFWRSVHMKQYWQDDETSPPFLFGSNTVFRKEAFINIGFYNESYKSNYEDVDICNRLKKLNYTLLYEPRAIARHLRYDNICSLLNSYWRWNLGYYLKEGYYSSPEKFIFKLKDNVGLANRYIEEDFRCRRYRLLYLDFLLALHHSLRDFEYFIFQNNQNNSSYTPLSFWLSLLDLTFFYHFDSERDDMRSLMSEKFRFLQNFFALNLIFGRFVQDNFKNNQFVKILYHHLLLSVYNVNNACSLDKLLNLVELHRDWSGLINRQHPSLNILFLQNLFLNFKECLESLIRCYPDLTQRVEFSAEETYKSQSLCEEGYSDENRNE